MRIIGRLIMTRPFKLDSIDGVTRDTEKIETLWEYMLPELKRFLLKKCTSLHLIDLAIFWSSPSMIEYTIVRSAWSVHGRSSWSIQDLSWLILHQYLQFGMMQHARALTINSQWMLHGRVFSEYNNRSVYFPCQLYLLPKVGIG